MLHLNESQFIAQGNQRKCYLHPTDENKCIKISKLGNNYSQQLEYKYYQRLENREISWEMLCKHYGVCETNLGMGYVFELVRDFDNNISHTIADYISTEVNNNVHYDDIVKALTSLKVYLIDQKIMVRNLRPYNFVFKRVDPHNGYAVIIDNIGHHNNLLHLSDYLDSLAQKDIKKKWCKFEENYLSK